MLYPLPIKILKNFQKMLDNVDKVCYNIGTVREGSE